MAVDRPGFGHESRHNESVEWYTPPEIFDALGVVFDVDPCSPGAGASFVPAHRHITALEDGLTAPWSGLAWVNPPYGSHTAAWMKRCATHGDAIALVFARTDVAWFQELAPTTSAVVFISGRVKFYQGGIDHQPGTPGAGSMLVAWGARAGKLVEASGLGVVARLSGAPGQAVPVLTPPLHQPSLFDGGAL